METIQKLKENTAIFLPENGLEEKLNQAEKENRKLIIKLGFDPTAPDLHLGHAVVLKKLKQFQDLGHQIVILVGSFTARIGDPTGKNKSRKPLNVQEVQHNAETYIAQLSKIIDVEKAQIVFNSDWLDSLSFSEVIQIMSNVTVAQLMQRNDFNKRFTENTPIAMHELVYPILQGFDSVKINADIEMGGTDQLFNCTMGRQLQETFKKSPQIVMCMPLLRGLDGKEKMSKSLNNIIGLTDEPNEMFGKTMSIPDDLILEFLELTTDFSTKEKQEIKNRLKEENPMNIKKIIAKNIINQYHDEKKADKAEDFFVNQFQNKNFEEKSFVPVLISSLENKSDQMALIDLCAFIKNDITKSANRRLIESGAVQVNNLKITNPYELIELKKETKIKIGKRNFYELV
ncbi:tyrosine--tRNA ligase [Flavobacterium johnsoniae]|uniref:Tyrosine--tRNA ligase n=1 Tax=Flavobacterium johnsoniae (strain ATCC 17061 / DSM 2064 / JCM 8514 / BCRC 14874 / CCUG 350202 / NBRC 14942 / NCIMB 11054 / UW101) TaxID=376686 RepID=A5FEG7_FLAJ1|nr:tyrosine--tRNA ligase [Flavobacterium johnsoniae]ABQ06400.1 predicted tyrosyl-tRNA synthetase [Flavobacterium johnsoniae UW101]OXE95118.1 tyrosine--tRNA ligase [Flavobacterium johnsoniae UW101]WQG82150.1 tyrosine--tRNA ligase [Flavobacterium johnsoniae UW101]SHK74227.1 tyrosyl-tRNA synthetase [Flavobacterium johnsoniae]